MRVWGRQAACGALAMWAAAAAAEPIYWVTAHGGIHEYDSAYFANRPKAAVDKTLQAKAIAFNITYADGNTGVGFGTGHPDSAARRQALEDALAYCAGVLDESGTLDIECLASQTDGGGPLASAGPFFSLSPGFQNGGAFDRLTTGVKPFPGTPEIQVTVDFGYTYNLSTNPAGPGQVDLRSVLVHEITHGLGVLTLASATGASVFAPQSAPNTYAVFDSLTRRTATSNNLFAGVVPVFTGSLADLTSNDLDWDGPLAQAEFGSRPPVFAPAPFSSGSSLAHFDPGTGAVMEPSIASGTTRREYAPFEIAALEDLGYAVTQAEIETVAINGRALIELNDTLVLTAVGASGTYAWSKDDVPLPAETASVLVRDPVIFDDAGVYRVTVETPAKATVVSPPFTVTVLNVGSLPAAGLAGIALAAGALALLGSRRMRRR